MKNLTLKQWTGSFFTADEKKTGETWFHPVGDINTLYMMKKGILYETDKFGFPTTSLRMSHINLTIS